MWCDERDPQEPLTPGGDSRCRPAIVSQTDMGWTHVLPPAAIGAQLAVHGS
jgi:hypothetical protein